MPALPWVKYLGASTANRVFRSIRKIAFAAHARPMTMLRAEHGLLSQGNDLLRQYSDGDICMYADVPELVPTFDAPPTHRYLGPVAWSPPTPLPGWWNDLEPQEKLIYVTLGSSGDRSRLPVIVEALAGLGLSLAVATAGAGCEALIRPGVRAASFLPGDLIADRCALVVCNGGSLASYQALQKGVPILALPSNLDQFLNSGYLKARNVGDLLRPEETTIPVIRTKASALLNDSAMLQAVRQMRSCIDRYDPVTLLTSAITELCTSGPRVA